jgi:hypothetical protein
MTSRTPLSSSAFKSTQNLVTNPIECQLKQTGMSVLGFKYKRRLAFTFETVNSQQINEDSHEQKQYSQGTSTAEGCS